MRGCNGADFVACLRQGHRPVFVLLFALTAFIASIAGGGFSYKNLTTFRFTPTSVLDCYDAYIAIDQSFPHFTDKGKEVVVIRAKDPSRNGILAKPFLDEAEALSNQISYALSPANLSASAPVVDGPIEYFFRYYGTMLRDLAPRYVHYSDTMAADALALFVPIDSSASQVDMNAWIEAYITTVADVAKAYPLFDVVATGPLTAQYVAGQSTGKGFALTNGAGLPFIAIVFWWRVGSMRLLLLPALSTILSLVVSYGVGKAFAQNYVVPGFQPDIQLFLSLALSIDYSFFLLMRWREERLNGSRHNDAVSGMMQHSGPVVFVSGSILVITWLALCLFPVNGLVSVGFMSAVTVALAVISNLTVTPAVLLAFRRFFGRAGLNRRIRCCCCFGFNPCTCAMDRDVKEIGDGLCCGPVAYGVEEGQDGGGANTDFGGYLSPPVQAVRADGANNPVVLIDSESSAADMAAPLLAPGVVDHHHTVEHNCYYRLSYSITRLPWSVVVPCAVFAAFIAGAVQLRDIKFTLFAATDFGKNSPTSDAYTYATVNFPAVGMQAPFAVLATTGAANSIFTDGFAQASCALAQNLSTVEGMALVPQGVFYNSTVNNEVGDTVKKCISFESAQKYWNQRSDPKDTSVAYYDYFANNTINNAENSVLITFNTAFDPFSNSPKLRTFVNQVRAILVTSQDSFPAETKLFVFNQLIQTVDAEHFTLQRFPTVIVVTLIIIFVLVALRFRAAIIPFKLALTIVVPIFFIFGLAVTVYQKGTLNGMGWGAVQSDGTGGISWLLPCSTVFLLIGLALDYDIFLFSRVYELRKSGMSDRVAINKAVEVSGPVISAAGVIMALAFAGMLANDDKFLNEFGFIAILGVLLDTFVVRTILVPAILSLGGWLNWWPTAMPKELDE